MYHINPYTRRRIRHAAHHIGACVIALAVVIQVNKCTGAAHAKNSAAYPLSAIKHDPKTPKQYLFMYQGRLHQYGFWTKAEVKAACAQLQTDSDMGCAAWNKDSSECTIVYLKGKPHVYWHEIAHCNGLRHD